MASKGWTQKIEYTIGMEFFDNGIEVFVHDDHRLEPVGSVFFTPKEIIEKEIEMVTVNGKIGAGDLQELMGIRSMLNKMISEIDDAMVNLELIVDEQ